MNAKWHQQLDSTTQPFIK